MEDLYLPFMGDPTEHKVEEGWVMYDVPVTFSIMANSEDLARAFVEERIRKLKLGQDHSPYYVRDHAFIDGVIQPCDCTGH